MIKFCPFMTYREEGCRVYCFEEECGLYDKTKKQCCIKTMANLTDQINYSINLEEPEEDVRFAEPYIER